MKQLAGIYLLLALFALPFAFLWKEAGLAAVTPAAFPLQAWQEVVGELDGRSCPSYPVCSVYARQAIEDYGLLVGSWMMLDRLIHEGGDLQHGHWIVINGEQRLYDSLQRNTGWLNRE